MKLIKQPSEFTCGQTCLAMITGIPVKEVVDEIGDGPTGTKDILGYLSKYWVGKNFLPKRRIILGKKSLPDDCLCMVYMKFKTRSGYQKYAHWVIWHGQEKKFYDPRSGKIRKYTNPAIKLTSYLPIRYNFLWV